MNTVRFAKVNNTKLELVLNNHTSHVLVSREDALTDNRLRATVLVEVITAIIFPVSSNKQTSVHLQTFNTGIKVIIYTSCKYIVHVVVYNYLILHNSSLYYRAATTVTITTRLVVLHIKLPDAGWLKEERDVGVTNMLLVFCDVKSDPSNEVPLGFNVCGLGVGPA